MSKILNFFMTLVSLAFVRYLNGIRQDGKHAAGHFMHSGRPALR